MKQTHNLRVDPGLIQKIFFIEIVIKFNIKTTTDWITLKAQQGKKCN